MTIKHWLAAALGALAAVTITPARLAAQTTTPPAAAGNREPLTELALEDLLKIQVYAASKFMQDVAQAPASVTIVTAAEIRNHGYETIADVLRAVRGFYVTDDRSYSYVGTRGFSRPGDYNSRVLLLVNGHRLNDDVYEQALIGTESPIDVSAIDHVEVVRGPSSSLYGTSAFFAVVNIVTRTGRSTSGVEVQGLGGSLRTVGGRVAAGGTTANGIDAFVSVAARHSTGNKRLYFPEFDTPFTSNGVARGADGDRGASVYGSATIHSLRLQGGYGDRTKTIPTAPFGTLFDDSRTSTRDAHAFADAEVTHVVRRRVTLQGRAAFDRYEYNGTFPYPDGMFDDRARGAWVTTEGSVVRQFDRHAITGGVEYRNHLQQDQYAADGSGLLLDDQRSSQTTGLYVEDELRVRPGLLVNAGVRWDEYYGMFGGTLNPRLAVIYSPFDGSALKLLYGRAFRAPNPYELYYDRNALSATLAPERIGTYEAVWEQLVNPYLRVTGSLFYYRASDLIAQRGGSDTIDGLYYQNADTANALGAEFEVQFDLPGRAHGRVAHTMQTARDRASNARLSNSPSQLGMFAVDAPLAHTGLLASIGGYGISSRRSATGAFVAGAVIANLTVSRPLTVRGLSAALSIKNLFDRDYADPASVEHVERTIPQDGRTVFASATWRF